MALNIGIIYQSPTVVLQVNLEPFRVICDGTIGSAVLISFPTSLSSLFECRCCYDTGDSLHWREGQVLEVDYVIIHHLAIVSALRSLYYLDAA